MGHNRKSILRPNLRPTVGSTCLQQDTTNLSDQNHIIFAHKGQSDIDEENNKFINIFQANHVSSQIA